MIDTDRIIAKLESDAQWYENHAGMSLPDRDKFLGKAEGIHWAILVIQRIQEES